MNTEKCNEWAEQKKGPRPKNPLTNRVLKIGGPKYKELDKDCEKFIVDINSICLKWLKDNHNDLYAKLEERRRQPSPPRPYPSSLSLPSFLSLSPPRSRPTRQPPPPCDEWIEQRQSPSPRNPRTRRAIKIGGPKYKELDKECDEFINGGRVVQNKPNPLNHAMSSSPPQIILPPSPQIIQISSSPEANGRPEKTNINFYPVTKRQKMGVDIKKYFSSKIKEEDGKACMSKSKTLLKYVTNPKELGSGNFGTVYSVTIPKSNISVAIKEGRIHKEEYDRALKKEYPMEYLFNKLVNDLIDDKVCPNFAYTYAIFFCDNCSLELIPGVITPCSETIVELFDGILDEQTNLFYDEKVFESILFQVFFAVASIQLKYGMFHSDIKSDNILVKVIPKGGYWKYNLDDITYKVPNHGYIIVLNDFGVSHSFMPGIT